MRIVKRKEFLSLPAGTLFSEYEPCFFRDLRIKEQTLPTNDFIVQSIADAVDISCEDFGVTLEIARITGSSIKMDFYCAGRDGAFEPDDGLFAVWEPADVRALIVRLQDALERSEQS